MAITRLIGDKLVGMFFLAHLNYYGVVKSKKKNVQSGVFLSFQSYLHNNFLFK
jgi:hypothetical protein